MTNLYSWGDFYYSIYKTPLPWQRAETDICTRYDLIEDHGSYYDAREDDLTPVEIKSCQVQNDGGSPGCFEIWESQIDGLLPDGKVGLLVYDSRGYHLVVASVLVSVIDLLAKGTVVEWEHPSMGRQPRKRIPWPELIPLSETFFHYRHAYKQFYDSEEVEDTILPIPPESTSGSEQSER